MKALYIVEGKGWVTSEVPGLSLKLRETYSSGQPLPGRRWGLHMPLTYMLGVLHLTTSPALFLLPHLPSHQFALRSSGPPPHAIGMMRP